MNAINGPSVPSVRSICDDADLKRFYSRPKSKLHNPLTTFTIIDDEQELSLKLTTDGTLVPPDQQPSAPRPARSKTTKKQATRAQHAASPHVASRVDAKKSAAPTFVYSAPVDATLTSISVRYQSAPRSSRRLVCPQRTLGVEAHIERALADTQPLASSRALAVDTGIPPMPLPRLSAPPPHSLVVLCETAGSLPSASHLSPQRPRAHVPAAVLSGRSHTRAHVVDPVGPGSYDVPMPPSTAVSIPRAPRFPPPPVAATPALPAQPAVAHVHAPVRGPVLSGPPRFGGHDVMALAQPTREGVIALRRWARVDAAQAKARPSSVARHATRAGTPADSDQALPSVHSIRDKAGDVVAKPLRPSPCPFGLSSGTAEHTWVPSAAPSERDADVGASHEGTLDGGDALSTASGSDRGSMGPHADVNEGSELAASQRTTDGDPALKRDSTTLHSISTSPQELHPGVRRPSVSFSATSVSSRPASSAGAGAHLPAAAPASLRAPRLPVARTTRPASHAGIRTVPARADVSTGSLVAPSSSSTPPTAHALGALLLPLDAHAHAHAHGHSRPMHASATVTFPRPLPYDSFDSDQRTHEARAAHAQPAARARSAAVHGTRQPQRASPLPLESVVLVHRPMPSRGLSPSASSHEPVLPPPIPASNSPAPAPPAAVTADSPALAPLSAVPSRPPSALPLPLPTRPPHPGLSVLSQLPPAPPAPSMPLPATRPRSLALRLAHEPADAPLDRVTLPTARSRPSSRSAPARAERKPPSRPPSARLLRVSAPAAGELDLLGEHGLPLALRRHVKRQAQQLLVARRRHVGKGIMGAPRSLPVCGVTLRRQMHERRVRLLTQAQERIEQEPETFRWQLEL